MEIPVEIRNEKLYSLIKDIEDLEEDMKFDLIEGELETSFHQILMLNEVTIVKLHLTFKENQDKEKQRKELEDNIYKELLRFLINN